VPISLERGGKGGNGGEMAPQKRVSETICSQQQNKKDVSHHSRGGRKKFIFKTWENKGSHYPKLSSQQKKKRDVDLHLRQRNEHGEY